MKPAPLLALGLVLFAGLALHGQDTPPPAHRLDGEIAGASWAALVPARWNGFLLLEAPDRHDSSEPLAEFVPTKAGHQALLDSGWAIATTNYRRKGVIVGDAIDDLRALRDLLATRLGCPRLVLIDGHGMGGLIAVLMAERHADEFHGFLARHPLFDLQDPRQPRLQCDHQPRGPLLLLSDRDSLAPVEEYIDAAGKRANAESIVPAHWFQPDDEEAEARPAGTDVEAIEALVSWVESREAPASRLPEPAVDETSEDTNEAGTAPAEETPAEEATAEEEPPPPEEAPPSIPVDE